MHHFFIEKNNVIDAEVAFSQTDYLHMTKVLRLKPGEIVSATDGIFFYKVKLTSLEGEVRGKIESQDKALSESPLHTVLVQGIAKGEKMDFIIQKATELGINEIIPLETTFSVVKLDQKKKLERTERWQKIAYEAAKQSKRAAVPLVHTPLSLKEILKNYSTDPATLKIVFWEAEDTYGLKELYEQTHASKVVLLIGPEGGFSQEEIDLAKEYDTKCVTLGRRILRTETAGIAALAVTQFVLGDLGGKVSAG